jgi:hypothetical protein
LVCITAIGWSSPTVRRIAAGVGDAEPIVEGRLA